MALQHLRSATADKRPDPAAMAAGQLAVNTADASPGLFFKNATGTLVKVGPVHVGTTAPNATPASGGTAGNSVGEQWLDTSSSRYVFKIWDGTAWRTEDGEFVNASGDTMTGALVHPLGTAATPSITFTGDLNTGIFSPGAGQVAVAANGTERLIVDASGQVGLNTAPNAARDFAIFRSSFPTIQLVNTDTGTTATDGFLIQQGALDAYLVNRENGNIRFLTNNTERLRITSAGLVGIGTSSPDAQLSVVGVNNGLIAKFGGNSAVYSRALQINEFAVGGTNNVGFQINSPGAGSQAALSLATQGVNHIYIDSLGKVGIGTTSPGSLLHLADAGNITVGTTTGTKIGTATTQKLGFYNATPVVQPAAVADATDAATVITQLNDLLAKLRTLGIIAT